ncbi:hypothetical protein PAI11_39110 [Patulibacter medicamentivorans]|jgi:uncharacterized protein YndB with AHSA1/START domain|uniref:Polyketide cyclase/dehydrase n=1 Tax=Patulibacter medicamentivorans TaxID=1097667 RepID=H0EAN7_9ACTN|nr:SRPBCC family protein [Patulibacter medicamentivorans]EHN09271.1 hypothetical protein PAI11_39110 [Patulibacter medicamentivorans]
MGKISANVTIPATPETVWEQIVDPSSYEKWLTIHTKWKGDIPVKYTKGATATQVVTMLGMPNTITWTVDELQEGQGLTISGEGMAGVKTTFAFALASDGNGGSSATIEAEFVGSMITGALGKAVEKDGEKNLNESLDKLAALVA